MANNCKCCCFLSVFSISILYVWVFLFIIASYFEFPIEVIYYDEILKNLTYSSVSEISVNSFRELNIKYMNKELHYEYLFKEDNNFHPCGKDNNNNTLYLKKNIECPINYIEITKSSIPSKLNLKCKTYKLNFSNYLHYSNKNVQGRVLSDIKISKNNFIFKYYSGIQNGVNKKKDNRRKLSSFDIFFNYKELRKKWHIIIFVFLSVLFICIIIDFIILFKGEYISFFHLIVIFLYYITIFLELYFYVYYWKNQVEEILKSNFEKIIKNSDDKKFQDDNYFLFSSIFLLVTLFVYFIIFSAVNAENSGVDYYYFISQIFNFIFYKTYSKCWDCVRSKINDKINDEIDGLDKDINNLNLKINNIKKENEKLIAENLNIKEKIKEKQNLLEKVQKNKNIEKELRIMKEEEKLQGEIKRIKEEIKINIKNLKNEIKKYENEIKYYKMKKFHDDINNLD